MKNIDKAKKTLTYTGNLIVIVLKSLKKLRFKTKYQLTWDHDGMGYYLCEICIFYSQIQAGNDRNQDAYMKVLLE